MADFFGKCTHSKFRQIKWRPVNAAQHWEYFGKKDWLQVVLIIL